MNLEASNIYTSYGLSQILFGVSLRVEEKEVVSLLGRNGVGKTTTLRSIMGLTPPRSGSIRWKGEELVGKSPFQIAKLGIGFVPEERRIFSDLTVWENLDVAVKPARDKKNLWTLDRVFNLFPALHPIQNRRGGFLSGGEQQMLTIARTLMTNPNLLLLDEPGEGLAPLVIQAMKEQLGEIKKLGLTMLICEHNVGLATALSDRGYVIDKGAIRYQGTIEELQKNEEVRKKYLMV